MGSLASDGPMVGTRVKGVKVRKANYTFTEGRTCGAEGCGTVLSRYNPKDVCYAHRDYSTRSFRVPRGRPFTIVVDCSDVDEVARRMGDDLAREGKW